ncbi:hypothetical protein D9M72_587010 [compost metagenome]
MSMRASAMVRTKSIGSTGAASASFEPGIGISMLIGTLSGGTGRLASVTSIEIRSSAVSPMPRMPPAQTLMPASRTFANVSSRSAKLRVVMISP